MNMQQPSSDITQEYAINLNRMAATWLAVNNPKLSPSVEGTALLTYVLTRAKKDELVDTWQRLGAFRSIRAFGRLKSAVQLRNETHIIPTPMMREGKIWWQELCLGTIEHLFQQATPQEVQTKLTYDTTRYRFLAWLEQHYQVLALKEDGIITLFVPDGISSPDLVTAWKNFIAHAFSSSELQRTFVLLVNSTVLSDRGFSVPDVPIVSIDQTDVLIALFYATLHVISQRLEWLGKEKQALLASANVTNPNDLPAKAETKFNNLNERLISQCALYGNALTRLEAIFTQLQKENTARYKRIKMLTSCYTVTATKQLKVTGAVMEKTVSRIEELLALTSEQLFNPPPLLTREPTTGIGRKASDHTKGICYACGGVILQAQKRGKKVTYTANKLILQSPSQTLQSYTQQIQPEICSTCALLALACPIKMIDGLIISLKEQHQHNNTRYRYEHQLKMFTTGELNIVAGRYVMIPCTEQAPDGTLLNKRLGGKEYALLKIASIFPADVLARFDVEALFGAEPLPLKQRHLIVLEFLIRVFNIHPEALHDTTPTSKQRYTALADAIRYVERDQLIFAIYRLITGFHQQTTFSKLQRIQLEDGLVAYRERLHMEKEAKLEQRFRDIAGLTGVLQAFISLARLRLGGTSSNGGITPENKQRDRELKKLLEEVDNPIHFTYEAAGALASQVTFPSKGEQMEQPERTERGVHTAQIWRGQYNYFSYDEAKRLLQDAAQVNVAERETTSEKGVPVLKLCYQDIHKIYTVLYEQSYTTEKARRDFTYELKLSLYSQFPELRPGNQN